MDFISIRVITENPKRLTGFYEQVSGLKATWYTDDFAELVTRSCTLAIAHRRTMEMFAAGAARPGDNHSVIIELRVDDVDAEYRRIA
jgi:predicted enzyme related to lactoylglutathione lyase